MASGKQRSTSTSHGAYRGMGFDAALRGVRQLVSKKKRRFQLEGFDLDLTYILPNIIAMGFPSTGSEGLFRNPMPEVQRFFRLMHGKGKALIINLCIERWYDASYFDGHCLRMPFSDHNPPPLDLIGRFCEAVDTWLAADSQNVVAIHCKAGKGRTGCLIAAYLVHCGFAPNAEAALAWFGRMRTSNGKGVTIPSQMRYVHYYEHVLRYGPPPYIPTFKITHFRFVSVPQVDSTGGCTPNVAVYCDDELVWDFKSARAAAIATAEAERAAAAAAAQRSFEALAQAEAAAAAAEEEEAERQWGAKQAAEEESAMQRRRAQSYGGARPAALGGGAGADDASLDDGASAGGGLLGARGGADGASTSPAVSVSDSVLQRTARNVGWVPFEMDPSAVAEQRRQRTDSIVGRTGGAESPRSISPRGGSDSDGGGAGGGSGTGAMAGSGSADDTAAARRYAQLSQRGLIGMAGAKAPLKRYHRFGAASANVLESEGALVMTHTHARRAAASAYAAAARAGLVADSLGEEGLRAYDGTEEFVDMDCTLLDLRVGGNVRVEITHDPDGAVGGASAGTGGGLGKTIATFWIHTAFIEGNALRLTRQAVDKANKDKSGKFAPRFAVELYGHPVPGAPLPPRAFKPTSASANLQSGVGGAKPQVAPVASAQSAGSLQGLVASDGPVKRGGGGSAGKLPWGAVEMAAAARKAEEELNARRKHVHSIRNNTQLWGALQQQRQVRAQVIKALNEEGGKGGVTQPKEPSMEEKQTVTNVNWDSDDDAEVIASGVEADGGAGGLLDALEGRASDSVRVTLQEPNFWSGMWTDTAVAAAGVRGAYREAGAPLPGDKKGGQGARDETTQLGQYYTTVRGVAAQNFVSVPNANSGMFGPPPAPMVLPGDDGSVDILGLPVSTHVRVQEGIGGGSHIASDSSEEEDAEQFDDYEQQLDEDGELLLSSSSDSDSSDSEHGVSIDINGHASDDSGGKGDSDTPAATPAATTMPATVSAARGSSKSGSIVEMPRHLQQQVQVNADGRIVPKASSSDGPTRRPSAAVVGPSVGMPAARHRSDADDMEEGVEEGAGGGAVRSVPMHVAKLRNAGAEKNGEGGAPRAKPVRRASLAKDSHARGLMRGGDASFRSPAAAAVLSSRGRGRRRTMLPKGGAPAGAEAAAKAKAAAAAAAAAAMPALAE